MVRFFRRKQQEAVEEAAKVPEAPMQSPVGMLVMGSGGVYVVKLSRR